MPDIRNIRSTNVCVCVCVYVCGGSYHITFNIITAAAKSCQETINYVCNKFAQLIHYTVYHTMNKLIIDKRLTYTEVILVSGL